MADRFNSELYPQPPRMGNFLIPLLADMYERTFPLDMNAERGGYTQPINIPGPRSIDIMQALGVLADVINPEKATAAGGAAKGATELAALLAPFRLRTIRRGVHELGPGTAIPGIEKIYSAPVGGRGVLSGREVDAILSDANIPIPTLSYIGPQRQAGEELADFALAGEETRGQVGTKGLKDLIAKIVEDNPRAKYIWIERPPGIGSVVRSRSGDEQLNVSLSGGANPALAIDIAALRRGQNPLVRESEFRPDISGSGRTDRANEILQLRSRYQTGGGFSTETTEDVSSLPLAPADAPAPAPGTRTWAHGHYVDQEDADFWERSELSRRQAAARAGSPSFGTLLDEPIPAGEPQHLQISGAELHRDVLNVLDTPQGQSLRARLTDILSDDFDEDGAREIALGIAAANSGDDWTPPAIQEFADAIYDGAISLNLSRQARPSVSSTTWPTRGPSRDRVEELAQELLQLQPGLSEDNARMIAEEHLRNIESRTRGRR